jgi:hypothetical protein
MLVDERDGPAETREPAATGRPSRSRERLRRHISHPELRPERGWHQASPVSADSRLRGSSFPSDPAGTTPSPRGGSCPRPQRTRMLNSKLTKEAAPVLLLLGVRPGRGTATPDSRQKCWHAEDQINSGRGHTVIGSRPKVNHVRREGRMKQGPMRSDRTARLTDRPLHSRDRERVRFRERGRVTASVTVTGFRVPVDPSPGSVPGPPSPAAPKPLPLPVPHPVFILAARGRAASRSFQPAGGSR